MVKLTHEARLIKLRRSRRIRVVFDKIEAEA
jgi:hypothetical protein